MDGRGWVRVFVEIGSGRLEMNGLVWYGRCMVWYGVSIGRDGTRSRSS